VKPPRDFQTNDGKALKAHDVVFDDGEEGSVITGPGATEAQAMQDALLALKGQEVEFELDNPREYQGVTKWKITGFPGKPKQGGSGAKREWVDQTPSMESQGAVKNAVTAAGMYHSDRYESVAEYAALVRELAISFYKIVQEIKTKAVEPAAAQPAERTAMQTDAIAIFGSEAAVQVAYRKMFGRGTSFDAITDKELEALIEQKNLEE